MSRQTLESEAVVRTNLAGGLPLRTLAVSYQRALLAENKAPRTRETYREALQRFMNFLEERGMPTAVGHVRREHVEAFIVALPERYRPATASNRYRALQQFFKWAVDGGRSEGIAHGAYEVADGAGDVAADPDGGAADQALEKLPSGA